MDGINSNRAHAKILCSVLESCGWSIFIGLFLQRISVKSWNRSGKLKKNKKKSQLFKCFTAGSFVEMIPDQCTSYLCAAFEDMLENPLNSTQWMNDPETGPVMLQISRIFQTLNRT